MLFLGHHHSAEELAQESRTPTAPTTTPNRLTIFGLSHSSWALRIHPAPGKGGEGGDSRPKLATQPTAPDRKTGNGLPTLPTQPFLPSGISSKLLGPVLSSHCSSDPLRSVSVAEATGLWWARR